MSRISKFVITLFFFSLFKIGLLYFATINEYSLSIFLNSTLFVSMLFWLVINSDKNIEKRALIAYSFTSILLFIDVVYYEYYSFLPSIKDIAFLGQVTTVKKSITHVIELSSIIMIIDLVPMYLYFKRNKFRYKSITKLTSKKVKLNLLLMSVYLLISYILPHGNEIYVFKNYGIYNYHAYDIVKTIENNFKSEKALAVSYDGYENVKKESGKYFGIAKNRNIIAIQLESFQQFLINKKYNGQEITPNLNELVKNDSIYFENYYQQVGRGNTSDSEFIMDNSMHSLGKESVYQDYAENYFYSLPNILKKDNYKSIVFHGNDKDFWNRDNVYPFLGIDEFIGIEDLDDSDIISIGLSDESLFDQSIEFLNKEEQPFYAKLITLTSHHPYKMPEELWELNLSYDHKETIFGDYLQSIHYTDKVLGKFIEDLKRVGLYDNSIIVLYGDHSGLYPTDEEAQIIMTDFLGFNYDYDEALKIPLIFHIPNSEITEKNSIVAGQIDFLPTLLNLLGIVEDSGVLFGRDLNNVDNGFVATQYYIPKGSFIDDEKIFIMSDDGIFEHSKGWKLNTKELVDINECRSGYEKAIKQIDDSNNIIKTNKLDEIFNRNYKYFE